MFYVFLSISNVLEQSFMAGLAGRLCAQGGRQREGGGALRGERHR